MLTLPIQRHGELIAFADDALPQRLHVALARPRVARDAEGRAKLKLLRWADARGGSASAAARLYAEVELAPSPAELAAAGLGGRDCQPLAWRSARVLLDGPAFDPVEALPSLVAGAPAAFACELSAQAAALLTPLLRADAVLPLQVAWSGAVRLRLPPVEVIASVDVAEWRRRVAIAGGALTQTLRRSLVEANARIEIRGAQVDAALEDALRAGVLAELEARLERLGPAGGEVSLHTTASEIADWPLTLSTTLDDFVPAASRRDLVEELVLGDDELGRVPPVEVRVFGDFGGALERVDLRLGAAGGTGSAGGTAAGAGSAELTVTDRQPRRIALGSMGFRWRRRLKFAGQPAGDWSAEVLQAQGSSLLLAVESPQPQRVEVAAIGLDLAQRWRGVRVALEAGAGPGAQRGVVELDAARPSGAWTVAPSADGTLPAVQARLAYTARDGTLVERGPLAVEDGLLVVSDPSAGQRLRLGLVPAGTGWGEVALAMVDLRHVDGDQTSEATLELRRLGDYAEWEIPLRTGAPRALQWRLHASFADGRFSSSPWQAHDGEGLLVVRLDGRPRREVQLLPIHFDPALAKQARVVLQGAEGRAEVVVADRAPRRVLLDGAGAFEWSVEWTRADGVVIPATAPRAGDDVIVLPVLAPDAR